MPERTEDPADDHFIKQLTSLSSTHRIEASEDVYSSNGTKLIAKGTAISSTLYERVITHKLSKPLESSVQVENAINGQELSEVAEKAFDSNPSLSKLASWKQDGETPVSILKRMRFNGPASTLLSVHQARNEHVKLHCVQVTLLAMGLLKKSQNPTIENIRQIAMAGMFHDIGEVYIDPTLFLRGGRQLTPLEWKQIAAHPVVGQILLQRIEGIPSSVSSMVMEHHERLDGFGYPKGIKGAGLSAGGQVLGAAETLSGLLAKKSRPLAHAELAMKLIPGEYGRFVIDLIAKAREEVDVRLGADASLVSNGSNLKQSINSLYSQLFNVKEISKKIKNGYGAFFECW